jgi:tetratricopeptide (TPR) repeat protein
VREQTNAGRFEFRMRRISFFLLALAVGFGLATAQDKGPGPAAELDILHYEISAEIIPENGFLKGETKVRFQVGEDILVIPFELNNRLSITEIVDAEGGRYSTNFDGVESERIGVRADVPFRAGTEKTLTFRYEGGLERQEYAFIDTPRNETAVVFPEGALLLTEGHWFPSYRLPVDSATAEVRLSVPLGYSVVAPGIMEPTEIEGVTEVFTWKSEVPLTRVPVVVSRFYRQPVEDAPVPLTFFLGEQHDHDLQVLTKEVTQVLEFFNQEYGAFPFRQLNIATVGNVVLPSSGSAGLVLLEDSFVNPRMLPVMELAEKIASQWWGYSARPKERFDAWLQDGFATYAALRYMEVKYPDRYDTSVAKQAISALKYEQRGAVGKGFDLKEGSPEYRSVVASKGAWVLYMLGQMMGKDQLNGLLVDWYKRHAASTVTTPDFVKAVQERSGQDLKWFFTQWLESTGVPDFRLEYNVFKRKDGTFAVRGVVRQDQEIFRMPLEVLVETKGENEHKAMTLNGKSTSFDFQTQTLPVRVRVDPDGKILRNSEQMQVQVAIALGEEYQVRGDFVEAVRQFEKAREYDPRSSLAAYRLGEVMFLQHSFTNSANAFRDALNGDLKPEWVETWTHIFMGKIYDILNQRERATSEYQKAINTKNDYNGAQAEAQKYLKEPFAKPQSIIG